MPLDPTIVLRGLPPPTPLQSPFEALQLVEQLRARRESAEARREEVEIRRQAGEERRQKAMDEAAKRQREKDVEARVHAAIRPHPTTGQPTIDWPTLLESPDVPPDVLFKLGEETDQAAQRLATLESTTLGNTEKKVQIRGAVARPVVTAGYAKPAWDAAVLASFNRGALTAEQRDAAYAITDPAQIKAATDAAIAQAFKPEALQKVETVDAEGKSVTQFVTPTEGATYAVPPKTATGELPSYQDTDAIVTLPNGKRITGKVGYNPKTNTYAPIGSTEPFPPGTKVDRIPTPVDPTVAAIRDLTLQTARQNAQSGMTPQQNTTFQRIADAYERSPLVKAADRTLILQDAIKQVRADPSNPVNQMSLAYGFIQIADTYQSAVREGELGNITALATRLEQLRIEANRIYSTGAFMPPGLAQQIATTSEQMIKAIVAGRQQKQREFRSRAAASGVGDAWDKFIAGGEPPADAATKGGGTKGGGTTAGGLTYQDYLNSQKKK